MPSDAGSQADNPVPGCPPDPVRAQAAFQQLVEVVARLRSPDGCPWDREQTLRTIRPYTLEETYEVLEAIDAGDDQHLVEELGDLLLQVILYAQIGADEGRFDLIPVLEGITAKMIRRHPHVFGDAAAATAEQVTQHWDHAKRQEKQRESALDGIPLALPALARTARLTSKAARAGADSSLETLWANVQQAVHALSERIAPLAGEDTSQPDPGPRGGAVQIGSLLFAVANLARKLGVNPEDALREANREFEENFRRNEQRPG